MASNVITKVLRLKDEASGALGKVGGAAKSTSKQIDNTGAAAAKAGATARSSAGSWTELSSKMNVMAQGAKAAFNSLKAMTQALADSRNQLADTSTRTGLTIKTLAGLRLAAEGSGQKLGSLASGLQQLPKRMADVARGTGEALIAFEALGVSATDDITGKLRPADEVLRDLIGKLNQVSDPTERSSLATQAFGRAGGALMQALSGSDLEDFTALAEKYGVSLAPEAIKQSAAWERSVANLGLVFDGLKDSISAALGGEGQGGAVSFVNDLTAGFLFLGTVATEVAGAISDQFRNMLKPVMAAFEAVNGNISAAEQIMEGFDFDTTTFDRLMDAEVIDKATAAMEDFRKETAKMGGIGGGLVLGSGAPATPAAAAAAAAGGAAKAAPAPIVDELADQSHQIQDLFDAINSMMKDTTDTARKAAETFAVPLKQSEQLAATQAEAQANWNGLVETAFEFGLAFDDAFLSMAETAQAEIAAIGAAFDEALKVEKAERVEAAAGVAGDVVGAVADPTAALSATGPWGAVIAGVLSIGEDFKEFFKGVFDGLIAAVAGILEDLPIVIFEIIPQFVAGLIGTLIPSLLGMIPRLAAGLFVQMPKMLVRSFGQAFRDIWEGIKDFFSGLFKIGDGKGGKKLKEVQGAAIDEISKFFGIEKFHSGGFVPRDGQFLLKQGERVVPPTGADTQTAGRGLAAFSGGGANVTINTSVVDSNAIDALGRELDRHFGSFGRSSLPVFGS